MTDKIDKACEKGDNSCNEELRTVCPQGDQSCIDNVKAVCPDMDGECIRGLTQMDYFLVGRENFNLSDSDMDAIDRKCRENVNCNSVPVTTSAFVGEQGYLELLETILDKGTNKDNRTGVRTKSIFNATIMFDLTKGFPALTTKKLFWNGVMGELLWFLSGKNDLSSLRKFTYGEDKGQKTIWDIDYERWNKGKCGISETGGAIYGQQWRSFTSSYNGFWATADQIKYILEEGLRDFNSRRLVLNAWNAADIKNNYMALPPCHTGFQIYIDGGRVNLKWTQRSVDSFLGLPFNIASYAMLCHIFAKWFDLKVGWLIGDLTNVHIYDTHISAIHEQLRNEPYPLCEAPAIPEEFTLSTVNAFTAKNFPLINYKSHPRITAPMAG